MTLGQSLAAMSFINALQSSYAAGLRRFYLTLLIKGKELLLKVESCCSM